jgi:predicted nucleic acid-binding protein
MPAPTVYLDTSVINFLFATDAPELQEITHDFFEQCIRLKRYQTIVSDFVIQELMQTSDAHHRARLLQVIDDYSIEVRTATSLAETTRLANAYLRLGALPPKKIFDALHVAFCVTEKVNYLTSWNYQHLANVSRERRLVATTLQEGHLHTVRILTPINLLEDESYA